MKSIALIFSLFFLISASAQVNTWVQKATYLGNGSYGTVGFAIGSKGYIGMGWDGNNHYTDLWEYDPVNNSWTQKASIPAPSRRYPSSFVINNKAYVCCGFNGSFLSDVWEYDPVNNSWLQKASFPGTARYAAASFAVNQKGYLCAGNLGSATGPYANDLWEYDPQNNSWLQKASLTSTERYGAAGFGIGSKGYVSCGVSYNGTYTFYSDLWEYDPTNNSWTQKANLPGIGRNLPAYFVVGSRAYVGTGNNFSTMQLDFYEYNATNNSWSQVANFQGVGRAASASFAIGNVGYVGTGFDIPSSSYLSDFWAYTAPVGIEEIDAASNLNLCTFTPSLGSSFVILQIEDHVMLDHAQMEIYNSLGQIALVTVVNSHSQSIDVSDLANGAYLFEVTNSNSRIGYGKFVISDR